MKALIQRVISAKVTVADELISSIGPGLCVLVGISREDTEKDVEYIAKKLLSVRLFDGAEEPDSPTDKQRWRRNVKDCDYELLCVSQFTLCSQLNKGNKPDFHRAAGESQALPLYESLLRRLRTAYRPERVCDGKFGAMMLVHIVNDGPVTVELESPRVAAVEGSQRAMPARAAALPASDEVTGTAGSEPCPVAVVQPLRHSADN